MVLRFCYIILLLLPLTCYASEADTTKKKITRQWTLTEDFTGEIPVDLDTMFSQFNRYRITDKYSEFNAYTGNYGLPLYQINFFDREWLPDNYNKAYYMPFLYTPANTLFVDTQVPFTELVWTNGGTRSNAEQTFRVRHSQNVNHETNFGFVYDIVFDLGQYTNQRAVNKTFLFHFSHNTEQYTAYFNAGINNILSFENGGITDEQYLSEYAPENVPVNLTSQNEANSMLKNRHIMLVQRYSPGSKRDSVTGEISKAGPVTFSHIGLYEWDRRSYSDSYPGTEFYDTTYIDDTESGDSLFQGVLSNTLRIDIAAGTAGRFRIGAGAGIRSELRHFAQLMPGDTLTVPDTITRNKSSLVLTGKVFNNIGDKFGWWATGDLWFQGYRAGDFLLNSRLFKIFTLPKGDMTWDATATMASISPSYWYTSWWSNNYEWQLDAAREFRFTVGSSLSYPSRHFSARFNYAVIDNFTYMNSDAMPAQFNGGLSVASLTLHKEFVLWKLHWDNTILLQESSNNEVLSLPLATGRSSFFFDHVFRFRLTNGEFNAQLGGEVFIHTLYNAMGYMPATGRYYNQTEQEQGNYPFINVFLNIKLKRTRAFLMFDHVNSGLINYKYFLVPDYPLNVRMFRFGVAWTFYN